MLRHKLIRKYSHIMLLLPFIFANGCFILLEMIIRKPEHYMYSTLDSYIPFTPIFIIPYVFWYFYIAVTAVFLFFRSREEFSRLMFFLSGGMMIACVIFALYPNGQLLRPAWLDDDIFSRMVQKIYAADSPINSLPSIHVIYSIGIHCSIAAYIGNSAKYRPIKMASAIAMVLICMSTVYVKQHSILDAAAGVVISGILYAVIYQPFHQMDKAQGPYISRSI